MLRMYGTYIPNQKFFFDQNFGTSQYNENLKKNQPYQRCQEHHNHAENY